MQDHTRYVDPEGTFDVQLPPGWTAEPDLEEGGVEVWDPRGVGSLHLLAFPQPTDEPADPAEELYAFLEEQGVELQEDEVEDLDLADGGEVALCEYVAQEGEEDEGEEEPTFWLMGVASGPGRLVFASYTCPAGQEAAEREAVRELLTSLRLRAEPNGKPGTDPLNSV